MTTDQLRTPLRNDPLTHAGAHLGYAAVQVRHALEASDRGDRRAALLELVAAQQTIDLARRSLVAELRVTGSSWPALGELLGISKQAAAKTYGADAESTERMSHRWARQLASVARATEVVAGAELEHVAPSVPVALPAVDVALQLVPATDPDDDSAYAPFLASFDLACPLCDALPGAQCVRADGGPTSPFHDGRPWSHAIRRGGSEPAWSWKAYGKTEPAVVAVEPAAELVDVPPAAPEAVVGVTSVRCPRCRAAVGASCVTRSGAVTVRAHEPRWSAFLSPAIN